VGPVPAPRHIKALETFHIPAVCRRSLVFAGCTKFPMYRDPSQSKQQLRGLLSCKDRCDGSVTSSECHPIVFHVVYCMESFITARDHREVRRSVFLITRRLYTEKVSHPNRPVGNFCSRQIHMARDLQGRSVRGFGNRKQLLPISILGDFGWPFIGSHRPHIS